MTVVIQYRNKVKLLIICIYHCKINLQEFRASMHFVIKDQILHLMLHMMKNIKKYFKNKRNGEKIKNLFLKWRRKKTKKKKRMEMFNHLGKRNNYISI